MTALPQSDTRQHILIVEDDEELAELIQEYLEMAQFKVTVHHEGSAATELALQIRPDLVILDLMLPGSDGISICRELRPQFDAPILMLTASGDKVDHILGLEVGADDFMNKPVEPRVLLAHVRALLRRAYSSPLSRTKPHSSEESNLPSGSPSHQPALTDTSKQTLHFGSIEIENLARKVRLAGNLLDLSSPEYDVLLLLARNIGQILHRDILFQSLHKIDYDGQNRLIDITVCQLRAKLAQDGKSHRHIKTVRNKGYLFVADLD